MSRERRLAEEMLKEDTGKEMKKDFETAREKLYQAWYDSELGDITPSQRTALIREIYRLHPNVAGDFEELTDEVVDGEFLTVAQFVAKTAKEDVIAQRDRARKVREEASRASAGQKRYTRRTKAQNTRGTNPRDIH